MRVNINYQFCGLDGKVIKERIPKRDKEGQPERNEEGQIIFKWSDPITLKQICEQALIGIYIDPKTGRDEQISSDEKLERWDLAQRIHKSKEFIDLKSEEITSLKELINKQFSSPATVAQAYAILDPKENNE